MNVKTLKPSLIVFVSLIITACTNKPEIRYVDKPYEVKVPVKCIVPKTECDFNRTTYTEVVSSMLECIVNHIENEKVCQ